MIIKAKAANMPSILVVDDEQAVRELLRDCFELQGYQVHEAASTHQTFQILSNETIDLITLDLKLGAEDGLNLARDIRANHRTPIIMVTGRGDMIDRVVGLEMGADDYISKPFHLREVVARVRSVLRRSEVSNASAPPGDAACDTEADGDVRFAFEGWVLDVARRDLKRDTGALQPLTTAEFNLLRLFVERPQRVLSRDVIMDQLKGHDWSPIDRSIDTLVGRLRKKVERPETETQLIKTVRGAGYVFSVPVTRI